MTSTVAPDLVPLATLIENVNLLLAESGEELRHATTSASRYIAGTTSSPIPTA